jgi:hypothetical protein
MRCHRLSEELQDIPAVDALNSLTPEMLSHVESCVECQAELKRLQEFGALLDAAFSEERSETPSFEQMHAKLREKSQRVGVLDSIRRFAPGSGRLLTPRFGYALVAIALVIGVVSLTELLEPNAKFAESVIGYEVTFTGVKKELAENPESICDILSKLELFEANIDSVSCEQFCRVSIIDLQSAEDAGRVVEAFSQLGSGYVSALVAPVTAPPNPLSAAG